MSPCSAGVTQLQKVESKKPVLHHVGANEVLCHLDILLRCGVLRGVAPSFSRNSRSYYACSPLLSCVPYLTSAYQPHHRREVVLQSHWLRLYSCVEHSDRTVPGEDCGGQGVRAFWADQVR